MEAEAGEVARGSAEQGRGPKRTRAEARAGRGDRPARGADDLGDLRDRRDERHQMAAVQMLGQIDGPSASNGLAALAVFSPRPEVRRRATETLIRRDPRDVVGRLIGMVHKPYKYQVRPSRAGLAGRALRRGRTIQYPAVLPEPDVRHVRASGAGRIFTPDVPFDPFSIRNLDRWPIGDPWHVRTATDRDFQGAVTPRPSVPIAPAEMPPWRRRAIAANPQNAQAILNQLVTNPNNRVVILPPGYTVPTDSSYSIPVHLVPVAGHQNRVPVGSPDLHRGRCWQAWTAFARQVQAQQEQPDEPDGPGHPAREDRDQPAESAGRRGPGRHAPGRSTWPRSGTSRSAGSSQAIRQANQDLQQQLAMDVRFIECDQRGDQSVQRPRAPGPEGDHRPGSGRRAREMEELVEGPARLFSAVPAGLAGDQADLPGHQFRRPLRAASVAISPIAGSRCRRTSSRP